MFLLNTALFGSKMNLSGYDAQQIAKKSTDFLALGVSTAFIGSSKQLGKAFTLMVFPVIFSSLIFIILSMESLWKKLSYF